MKERIRQIMEISGMSQQDFSAKLGVSPASLSSIYTGRTNPTNNHVMAIHRAFPDVSVNWLMFGEGEMYGTSSEQKTENGTLQNSSTESSLDGDVVPMSGLLITGENTDIMSGMRRGGSVTDNGTGRREASQSRNTHTMGENAPFFDKKSRKVKEIRVFFDDGTYESFVPSGK